MDFCCQNFPSKAQASFNFKTVVTMILEPKKIKSIMASTFSPIYLPGSDGTRCNDLSFLNVEFQASFLTLLLTFIKRLFCLAIPQYKKFKKRISSVQSLSHVQLFATPRTAACQASLSITNSQSLLKLMSIESVMPSNHLILCCPLLLSPSIFPNIRIFSNESVLHIRWPKYWSFSISPSNEYSGLISFRMGWLDLLAVQGTLKSLLQHHSSKASILWHSAFFIV